LALSVDDAEGLADLVICVCEQVKFQHVGYCLLLRPVRALTREHDELDAGLALCALCASCNDIVFFLQRALAATPFARVSSSSTDHWS
jgi:hypothetical protein